MDELGPGLTPELRAQEQRVREESTRLQNS
jgi:hypothetical protein